jgi:hypothetical protein
MRVCAALLLVVTLLATPLAMSSATAAPGAPTALSPSGIAVSGDPVLQWTRTSGSARYEVQIAASSSFSSTLYSTSTSNRRAVPTVHLPLGEVWWRVRGIDAANSAGSWAVTYFDHSQVAGPTPLSPTDGTVLAQPADPPLLSWTPVTAATSYEVEIDAADSALGSISCDFINAVSYPTKTTALVVPNPQPDGRYCWQVRAVRGTGLNTTWSTVWTYGIGPLAEIGDANLLNSPDSTVEDVVFNWAPVPGAKDYEIRVSTDDSFNKITDTRFIKGTRYSPPVTYDNDQYWWQVRARNVFGATHQWTDTDNVPIREFRRAWSPAPMLLHPADTLSPAASDALYYQWTPVRLATRYRLDVGPNANFSPGTFKSCYTTQTTYTPGYVYPSYYKDLCMPSAGEATYWRVQALDGPRSPEVNGILSSTRQFVYDPGLVTQLSPIGGETVAVPTLRWAPARDADAYAVKVSWAGGSVSRTTTTNSLSWTPTGSKLDPTKSPFTWVVQSIDHNGDRSPLPLFGAGQTFSLSGSSPVTGVTPLTPITPSGTAGPSARFPELTWEPKTGAAYYRVYVGTAGSGFFQPLGDSFPYPAATDDTDDYIAPGSYDWFAVAYDSIGNEFGIGSKATFTVSDLPAVSGQKIALDGSGLDAAGTSCGAYLDDPTDASKVCLGLRSTPVLDWSPVSGAGYYMVYVSRDREMTNLVFGQASDSRSIPTTQNSRWSPVTALPDSQAGDAYYWFIRPCKAPGTCAPDPTLASNAFNKRSSQVQQISPREGDSVANDVTFDWADYLATNQDAENVNVSTKEQSGQAASAYHLQVGSSPAFLSPLVDDVTVDQTTYTAFAKTYPEGLLYWRVQAVDGSSNGLAWSPVQSFTKASPQVTPIAPSDDAVVSGTQPFRWTPLTFAASYDLEVYKNNDQTASLANRVLAVNSAQVAYTMTTPLPVSSLGYAWRVRRVDADAKKGAWSAWSSFTVSGGIPQLVAPSAAAYVSGSDSLFSWKGVSGASAYTFERRPYGGTTSSETVSTVALAWAPTSKLADGSWQWRVTAKDLNNQPMGSSAWQSFTVDSVAPTVLTKSPTKSATAGANFVATFSEPVINVNGTSMKLFVKGRLHPLAAVVALTNHGKTATLNPVDPLTVGKIYTANVTSAITDRARNALVAKSWTVTAVR